MRIQRNACPNCDAPLADQMVSTCPYCHAVLKPWALNASWAAPVLMTLLAGLLAVVAVDAFADLGMLKWVAKQVGPKDPKVPWFDRQR
ncbi:MAG TPA: hypothetical protein PKD86_07565 [Gemmatales bacterium]|nr:hypothetical protein [Gemmatales bacterium]HMP59194.1 hypothetical protein [Gemmatales bacterium]